MNWSWDVSETDNADIKLSIKRWRRGPVTFYKYKFDLGNKDYFVSYWIYILNDFGFAIHPPKWLGADHDYD